MPANNSAAYGLQRAHEAGIPTEILESKNFKDREAYDKALQKLIDTYSPQFIILAGFMRILSTFFVEHYAGRILNIHPALLPQFPGLDTHQKVLIAGIKRHGATVHFVTEELDGGPIIAQASRKVSATDTVESLSENVLELEHILYPLVIRWIAEGRLKLTSEGVLLDNRLLPPQGEQILAPH